MMTQKVGELRVSLLGGVRIEYGSGATPAGRITRSLQTLLAYLILQRHRRHPREVLSGLFWGDQPEYRARGCLNTALWRLRRLLEPSGVPRGMYLINTPQGEIGFNRKSAYWLDVEVLEECANRVVGQSATPAPADVQAIDGAVRLYQGELLEGFYADWVLAERERVRTLYLDSLTWLMRHHIASPLPEQGVAYGQRILRHDPLREEVHRELIRLYIRTGQRGLALSQYEACRRLLLEELGAEPLEETKALYAQIAPVRSVRPSRRAESVTRLPPAIVDALRQTLRGLEAARSQLDAAMQVLDAHLAAEPASGQLADAASSRDRRVTRA